MKVRNWTPDDQEHWDQLQEQTTAALEALSVEMAQLRLGDEPDQAIVRDLSIILQELSATFVRHPQARRDPEVARPVVDFLARQRARQ